MSIVKSNLYCMSFNRKIKTLLSKNCVKPEYISVISILLLAGERMYINHVA